jgi:hypothetical protein
MRNRCPAQPQSILRVILGCLAILGASLANLQAAPYASRVSFPNPTTVTFILNEPADSLSVSINGAAPVVLDGTSKGLKTFNLNSASDRFSITATKNDPIGYTIATGNTIDAAPNGFSQPTAEGGYSLISDDADPWSDFNSPRGITVATDPTNPMFGITYIANSAAGTPAGRSLGDGLYALRADQSDAFGFGGHCASGWLGDGNQLREQSLPAKYRHRLQCLRGGLFRRKWISLPHERRADQRHSKSLRLSGDHQLCQRARITAAQRPFTLRAPLAGGNLTLYTLDEDLTSSQFSPGGSTTDKNSVWRYDIGSSPLPFSGTPTKVNLTDPLLPNAGVFTDMDRAANGNFYLAQNRLNGNEPGIVVLGSDGSVLFDSLTASRSLLGDPAAVDILRSVFGIAISRDGRFLAGVTNYSDVFVVPLDANGIPNIAGRS